LNSIFSYHFLIKDYTIDFYFRQLWNDERLAFNFSPNLTELRVGADFAKKIWVPDTFFVNGKQVSLHISTTTDTNTLLRIKSNGDVLYSLRLKNIYIYCFR
jgi:hypothetical protein